LTGLPVIGLELFNWCSGSGDRTPWLGWLVRTWFIVCWMVSWPLLSWNRFCVVCAVILVRFTYF